MSPPLNLAPDALAGPEPRPGAAGAPSSDRRPIIAAHDTRALLAYIGTVASDLASIAERSDLPAAAYFLNLARMDALIYDGSGAEPRSSCALAPAPSSVGS